MGWRDERPTYKQLNFIKELEDENDVTFTGTTKGEAADFIKKYVKMAKDTAGEFAGEEYRYNYYNESLNG